MSPRSRLLALLVSVAAIACGSDKHPAADAGADIDASPPVGDAPTCPKPLLTGGIDVAAQGWMMAMQPPATLSNGPDYVMLQTSTSPGTGPGGQLLLYHPGAVEMGKPFKIQVVMLVEMVSPHNPLDSAAAILGSLNPPVGISAERNQMIYLDPAKIGWADGTQAFTFAVTDGAYHTYELSVDAGGNATVTADGTQALTRTGFTTNGAIALGDQTNDRNVDSMLRIRSVTQLCP